MAQATQAIVMGLMLAVTLMTGVVVVDSIVTTGGDDAGIRVDSSETVLLNPAGEWTRIDTVSGYDETVVDSRGYAVNLTGANDSYVQTTENIEIASDDTWTVAAWGRVDSDASSDRMTLVSADGRVVIEYDGGAGNWTAWYYDEGSTNSYRANVSAPDQPSSWALVAVASNGTHMTISRNGTAGETVAITGDNIADAPVQSDNWHGRMDELRTFDDALNTSQQTALHSDGVAPLPDTNRTSRAMFDEPSRDTQRLFFTASDLETSNATFSAGLPGSEMDGVSLYNDLTGTTDYRWDSEGPRIMAVDGGELDGAPAAYVDYERESATTSIIDGFGSAVRLAALLPILFIVTVVLMRVRSV